MRPTIPELGRWELDGIMASVFQLREASRLLVSSLQSVAAATSASDWSGRTHDAAERGIAQEADHAREVVNVFQQIADEAHDAHTDLTHAREYVLNKASEAYTSGFSVSDTGQVTHPTKPEAAAAFENYIQQGLDAIDAFDERYGAALAALQGDLAAMVNGQPDITTPTGRRVDPDIVVRHLEGLSADERSEYVSQLSDDDLRRLVHANPDVIGNMDSIPFATRFAANEINVRNALDHEIRSGRGDGERAQKLRGFLAHHVEPTTKTGGPVDNLVERTLLSFSNNGNGRWVEVVGTMTPTTRNVTTYIPGTSTTLNGSQPNYETARRLAQATGGPVILYADGDFPDGVDDAASRRYALDMAPRLVDFSVELDRELQQVAPQAVTTFLGHSYGGAVLGSSEQIGLVTDRAIYASSAGTGVYDGPWRDPSVERYSLTAPGDFIHLPQALPGSPIGDGDPDRAPGVTRLDTGFYGNGDEVRNSAGHGGYFNDSQSTAFRNMVAVITGDTPTEYVQRSLDDPIIGHGSEFIEEHPLVLPGVGPLLEYLQELKETPR